MINRNALARVLAGVLVLLIGAEWLLPGAGAPGLQVAPAIPAAVADRSIDANIAQWANIVLARPILSRTRRPAPVASLAVDDTLPRLSAIIVIGGIRHAIFAADGEKPQLVAQGGQIGAYQIMTVAADSVNLLGPDGLLTVRPQYASPAAAPAPPGAQ